MERRVLIKGEEGVESVVTVQHQRRKRGCTFCNALKALIKVREMMWEKGVTLKNIDEKRVCSGALAKVENVD